MLQKHGRVVLRLLDVYYVKNAENLGGQASEDWAQRPEFAVGGAIEQVELRLTMIGFQRKAAFLSFVESVRHFRDRVSDPELKAAISGFIGQEAIHSREHARLNEYLLERGIDTKTPEKAVKFGLSLLERLPPKQQLACTTLMEHFTALLAEQLLTDEDFTSKFDPEFLPMWQWHALEELGNL